MQKYISVIPEAEAVFKRLGFKKIKKVQINVVTKLVIAV